MTKVLVGMSGGIDSSVVAYLLKNQGYDVTGITMSVWKQDGKYAGKEGKNSCFSPDKSKDIEKAREICSSLGIEYRTVDISDLYESIVLQNFRNEYLNGRTPNPCVWCNRLIKFGAMLDFARQSGLEFDYFATGHYARIEKAGDRYALKRATDVSKDQSYFLYRLTQEQLAHTLFPLGEMSKTQVKEIDFKLGYHDINQTESQDFYGGHYTDLLDVQPKSGDIVDENGKVLGHHQGMWNYTIGQRKGLGIAAPYPLYVIGLDPEKNLVVVGYEDKTHNTQVLASQINWVACDGIPEPIKVCAKIRSTGQPVPCIVSQEKNGMIRAVFESPVKAATCGQSLVVFDNDTILCGGIIEKVD